MEPPLLPPLPWMPWMGRAAAQVLCGPAGPPLSSRSPLIPPTAKDWPMLSQWLSRDGGLQTPILAGPRQALQATPREGL